MPVGFNIGLLGILNRGPRPKLKPPAIRTRPPACSRSASPSDQKAIIDFSAKVQRSRKRTRKRNVIPRCFGKAHNTEYE